jgi:predicted DsbA family dithiol-disulfide isomerase
MMTVELRYYTDPACEWSWASEPKLRRLLWELGDSVAPRWVMGGLARTMEEADHRTHLEGWLEMSATSGMPCDPRLWLRNPISSTYPACQAVRAACEQGWEAGYRYLRRLREGLLCEGKRLDHAEALIAEAGPAGLDRARFEIDLRSHAITEQFGADLEEVRTPDDAARADGKVRDLGDGRQRFPFPTAIFVGSGGERRGVYGWEPYDAYHDAALACGGAVANEGRLEPLTAIDRFGRCATRELEALSGRPRPVLEAELWALARDWKLKPVPVLTGTLWELA